MRFLVCLFVLIGTWASAAQAQSIDDIFGVALRRNAEQALSVYGITAVPTETASTLVLDSDAAEVNEFRAAQLGGGFALSESFPLYLEGFIGFNRYDPVLLLSEGEDTSELPLRWTTVAATGGVGWQFALTDHLSLLPLAHLSIGRIQTDTSIGAQIIANQLDLDTSFIDGGGLTVGGVGGSLSLVYNQRWENDYEADFTLRHTHLHLRPIGDDRDIVASADAITTAFWSRLRIPTGLSLFNRPIRFVTEASGSYLPGDQGRALATSWLLQGGFGGEIDFSETFVPLITTTRLVMRYTRGERLEGFSIGLAASF
ncbi:MAG: autotransporter outer membrane beta-barrel domain-containing protein [Pseudomonadota bacterium]